MLLEEIGPADREGGALRAVEWPKPEPRPDEVLIASQVCAVCHTELDQIEGRLPAALPRIPGHQLIGTVVECGSRVDPALLGRRVGLGWIASACGECRWCRRGDENLCPEFRATGQDRDGGYAEFVTARAAFAIPIPDGLEAAQAAPLLCAGAIGLRSLRLSGIDRGGVLGLTGFGASNHLVLQLACALFPGIEVLVWARDPAQRRQALELGATWAGSTEDRAPAAADAIIDTTPAWTPVLAALHALAPGGRLVINAIRKEDHDRDRLGSLDYPEQLWREKEIKSVANVTRRDIADVLALAAEHGLMPEHRVLPLKQANDALALLRRGGLRGALVLRIDAAS